MHSSRDNLVAKIGLKRNDGTGFNGQFCSILRVFTCLEPASRFVAVTAAGFAIGLLNLLRYACIVKYAYALACNCSDIALRQCRAPWRVARVEPAKGSRPPIELHR